MRRGRCAHDRGTVGAWAAGVAAFALAGLVAPGVARADAPSASPASPIDARAVAPESSPASPSADDAARASRPRLSAAVGFGWSLDSAGFSGTTEGVPAMFATGGVGADAPVGFELAAFGSSAVGRFRPPAAPVDRLALDAMGVVRPLAWALAASDGSYGARVLRALGVEIGLGLERDGTTVRAGSRAGLHVGARVEVPFTSPGVGELRLRIAARRLEGFYTPRVGDVDVGDSVELYAALVTVF